MWGISNYRARGTLVRAQSLLDIFVQMDLDVAHKVSSYERSFCAICFGFTLIGSESLIVKYVGDLKSSGAWHPRTSAVPA